MYGIEHNANAVNTILNQDFLYWAPIWVNVLIIFFICLFIGLVVPRLSILLGTVVSVGLFLIFEVASLLVFTQMNTIIFYFSPVVALVLGFAGVITYRVLTEEKDKQFIKKRFANYVNASVVEELLKNPKALQLGGEKKYLTVLFSDVRGFTTISEKLGDPQLLVALLNDYLGAMTEIIFAYDGTLDKYVGDEIMAFWGAPVPQADHQLRACKTALDQMYYLNNVLNPRLRSEGRPELDIGIGINTGIMTVGNMGSKNRMDYTLMGDNVNLGARLEGTNKVYGSHIIISEFTYNDVKDQVIVRELDNIKVKGKTKPVRIYELIEVIGHDPSKTAAKLIENK
jgi:adenylate cyclase